MYLRPHQKTGETIIGIFRCSIYCQTKVLDNQKIVQHYQTTKNLQYSNCNNYFCVSFGLEMTFQKLTKFEFQNLLIYMYR